MTDWIRTNRIGLSVLAATLVFCAVIFYWLSIDTTRDKIYQLTIQYFHLMLENRQDEANALIINVLDEHTENGALDRSWASLASQLNSGYKRLQYSIPVIKGSPENEEHYAEIAILIEMAPPAFHQQVKPMYLQDLANVPGINREFLRKYGLTIPVEQ